jgi:hypothetical protein
MMPRVIPVSGPHSMVGPMLGDPQALTSSEGGIVGQGVALVSSSDSLPHSCILFCCKTLLYQILNKKYNIFILRTFNL